MEYESAKKELFRVIEHVEKAAPQIAAQTKTNQKAKTNVSSK